VLAARKAAAAEVKVVELVSTSEIAFVHFLAKYQNTSTKFQINSKFEISMTETSNLYF